MSTAAALLCRLVAFHQTQVPPTSPMHSPLIPHCLCLPLSCTRRYMFTVLSLVMLGRQDIVEQVGGGCEPHSCHI